MKLRKLETIDKETLVTLCYIFMHENPCLCYRNHVCGNRFSLYLEQLVWCRSKLSELFRVLDQQGKSEGFDSCDRPSNLTQIGLKSSIFQPVWPWNLMDDHPPPPHPPHPPPHTHTHTHKKKKNGGWPSKTIGHLFYATSSFVQHFVAIDEFKLELQCGNA